MNGDGKLIYVDVDETICHSPDDGDYSKATPIQANIDRVNALYEKGHTIVYWTARGMKTGLDWQKVTKDQLSKWGAKYDELKFGKPPFDILIDDKCINTTEWEKGKLKI